ncbi:sugar-transfer associated ATP-grasp domain-containing protein [Streptomyces phytophilus]|uniref:sugar-transfer associated ATP-grasp domain-containing protein n=1 Tax=Streptomyces phytophilus TaxID=722715 RepID=UPI0015F05E10|nr:sugar-transfer associated ATP-grasp domain-containing protein [Streptomyces phytophilus]
MTTRGRAINLNIRQAGMEDRFRARILPPLMWPGSFGYQARQLLAEHLPVMQGRDDRKSAWRMGRELLALGRHWGCVPFHYFRYGLYQCGLDLAECRTFLPETVLFARLLPQVNRDTVLLDDKVVCKRVLASGGVPQPRLLLSGDASSAFLPDGVRLPLQAAMGALPAHTLMVVKPARYSSGGSGVTLLMPRPDREDFSLCDYAGRWGSWLIEEHASQHEETATLNPSALNTFRVITCLRASGAETLYCMLKLGGSTGHTDNSGAGGLQVRVDIDTGELDRFGYDRRMHQHQCHPVTGRRFAGHTFSAIKGITELAERAAHLFPQTPLIGWDIALTPQGPTVIEGNSGPSLAHIQRTHQMVAPILVSRLKELRNRPLI